jgi:23S rRNA pseudouridine1911/1915/1917 synthase
LKLETVPDWDEVNRGLFYDRNGIVHRLDKETSGVLVMAKTPEAYIELLRQFRERLVRKTYLALVHGQVEQETGVVDELIGRLPWNRKRFGVLPGGRRSVTEYRVIKTFQVKGKDRSAARNLQLATYSLLELSPRTGRTHQIRVHMKHLGHPVVGDELYAGRKTARADRKWCPRLWLHARSLEFTHPKTKKKVKFEAELPRELEEALKSVG